MWVFRQSKKVMQGIKEIYPTISNLTAVALFEAQSDAIWDGRPEGVADFPLGFPILEK